MKSAAWIVLLAASVALPTSAAAPKITLTCSGTQVMSRDDIGTQMPLPWSETYVIDVGALTFCGNVCDATYRADLSSAAEIVLRRGGPGRGTIPMTFNIATGAVSGHFVTEITSTSHFILDQTGTCRRS